MMGIEFTPFDESQGVLGGAPEHLPILLKLDWRSKPENYPLYVVAIYSRQYRGYEATWWLLYPHLERVQGKISGWAVI